MSENKLNRRAVLGLAGTGLIGSLSGCSAVLGEVSGNDSSPPPDPVIKNVTAEVQNFRQTQEYSTTYILIVNEGGLGELKLTMRAQGEVAVYDSGEQVFSLKAGQELQTRFELFTHEGADALDIRVEATATPDNYDTYTVTEQDADDIDFSSNN